MKKTVKYLIIIALAAACHACDTSEAEPIDPTLTYFFDAPAQTWEETLPLGNGRIGMMPDGKLDNETVVLNESSVWSGSPQNADNPEAAQSLPEIRRLLFEGRNDEAQELMYRTFTCGGVGSNGGKSYEKPYGSYQLLGNLRIGYDTPADSATAYRRELNLGNAITRTEFSVGDTLYQREAFTSFAHDVGVIRLTSSHPQQLRIAMDRKSNVPCQVPCCAIQGNCLYMEGQLPAGTEQEGETNKGVLYGAAVRVVLPHGGEITNEADTMVVANATEVTLLVAMATDYYGANVHATLKKQLGKAAKTSYEKMRQAHVTAYRKWFDRVKIDLGHRPDREAMPIKERQMAFVQDQDDPSLAALYYQFGRYLLISATRPGTLPPNLQGLWANTIKTPWNGDFHLNINLQMNLWPAEKGNLSELHRPFIDWTRSQVESGKHTAQVFYSARGWVTHILGNPWQFTSPGEGVSWGSTNTTAAWLCAHLYQHYLYTQDKAYLQEVYPVMHDAALFFVDMLVEDPRSHYLVTAPTTSPENSYLMPNGTKANVCAGSTMDNQIVRELFGNTIQAANILGIDQAFADTLAMRCNRLQPTSIGEDGRVMEWLEPFGETDIHHRHVSHLYGLYPANEISVGLTPDLAEAARKTLEVRGDESTGWSMAWKINLWARLHDGDHAFKLLTCLLHPCGTDGFNYHNGGGSYPNLFCAHPPFQIDGNYGGCAGIGEMLLQSQCGYIEPLPALPSAWPDGQVKGLCTEGAGEVDFSWQAGKLATLTLRAKADYTHRIKLGGMDCQATLNGKPLEIDDKDMLTVKMEAGDVLTIEAVR